MTNSAATNATLRYRGGTGDLSLVLSFETGDMK